MPFTRIITSILDIQCMNIYFIFCHSATCTCCFSLCLWVAWYCMAVKSNVISHSKQIGVLPACPVLAVLSTSANDNCIRLRSDKIIYISYHWRIFFVWKLMHKQYSTSCKLFKNVRYMHKFSLSTPSCSYSISSTGIFIRSNKANTTKNWSSVALSHLIGRPEQLVCYSSQVDHAYVLYTIDRHDGGNF